MSRSARPQPQGVDPFAADGVWLRAALHTHTTESDGTLPPWALVAAYAEAGFDVVAITDHWRLTKVDPPAVAGGAMPLVTIPAAELCYDLDHPAPGDEPGPVGEFLAYGIDHIPDDPGGDRANWFVNEAERYEQRTFPSATAGSRWAAEQGAVTYAAHPYWTGLDPAVLLATEGFSGLEVFNGSSEIETGRGDSSPWWDALLGAGRSAFAIATDDQHYPLFELGLAWTMLRAADRSREGAIEALRAGMAYCSNGPAIVQAGIDADGSVEVACSPCRAVVLAMEAERGVSVVAGERGRRMGEILDHDGSGLITRARLDVPGNHDGYRRVIVVDAAGRRAWTNPLP